MLNYLFGPSASFMFSLVLILAAAVTAVWLWRSHPAPHFATDHECVIDFDRSTFNEDSNGMVSATCAIAGCHKVMLLGKNVASHYKVAA